MRIDQATPLLIAATIILTPLHPKTLWAATPPKPPSSIISAFDCQAQRLVFYDYEHGRTIASTPIRKPGGHGHLTTVYDLSPIPGQAALVLSSPDDAARQAATTNIYRLDLRDGHTEHITGAPLASDDHPMIRIKGRVLDSRGWAVEGMTISAIRTNNQALTDSDGWFAIEVPQGYVHLLASLDQEGPDTFGELELLHQEDDIDDAVIAVHSNTNARGGFSLATPAAAGQHLYTSYSSPTGHATIMEVNLHDATMTPLPLPPGARRVHQLAISPDGQRLLLSERDALSMIELKDMSYHHVLTPHGQPSATWLNDTHLGLTGADEPTAALLDLKTQHREDISAMMDGAGQRVHGFSPDERWMFLRAQDRHWMLDIAHQGSPSTRPIRPLELDCDPQREGLQRCEHLCAVSAPMQLDLQNLMPALSTASTLMPPQQELAPAAPPQHQDDGCTISSTRRPSSRPWLAATAGLLSLALAMRRRKRQRLISS